jgi:GLPGLI family protein
MKTSLFFLFLSLFSFGQKTTNEGKITYSTFYNESEATEELKRKSLWQYQFELEKIKMAENFTFELHYKDSISCFKMLKKLPSDAIDINNYNLILGQFYGYVIFYTNKEKGVSNGIGYMNSEYEYVIKYDSNNFVWKYTNETKVISGYTCYKAETEWKFHARGKDHTYKVIAWYCPEIPLPYCPNKYPSLPGLVLELSEAKRTWIVNKIELNTKSDINDVYIKELEKVIEKQTKKKLNRF